MALKPRRQCSAVIPERTRLALGFFLAIVIANLTSVSPSPAETSKAISETITIAESDYGCADKAVTEEAIRKPLQWEPNLRGRKGFWLPFGGGFSFSGCNDGAARQLGQQPQSWGGPEGNIIWSRGDKARLQKRDGELACLEPLIPLERPHTGICGA